MALSLTDLLPHRPPMLLVDEVELIDGWAVGRYTIRGDEFFLQGHFPGHPIVPGVILCEMLGQSACVLIPERDPGDLAYFAGLDKVRFRRPVRPGDTITFRSQLLRNKGPFYFLSGTGQVGDEICVTAEFSFAVVSSAD